MTPKRLILFALAGMLALAACAPAATQSPDYYSSGEAGAPAATSAPAAAPPYEGEKAADATGAGGPTTVERLVIRNASLTLVVTDPVVAVANITALANGLGGYVLA